MAGANARGSFVWHELMTRDPNAAAAFYEKVVGWTRQGLPQDASYQMFLAQGVAVAGLMRLPEAARAMGASPSWLLYIGTPDVDQTVRLAAQSGGTVLRAPSDIPNVGRFAVIGDPQGAVFAAFTPADPSMAVESPGLGDFSWHELVTTDSRAGLAFYRKLFGWEKTGAMEMGRGMGSYLLYGWKGRTLGGMYDKPRGTSGPPCWLAYAKVADAKRAARAAKQAGGRIVNGPMEVPGGDWVAVGLDPHGAMFAVHSAPAAAGAPEKDAKADAAMPKAAKKPVKAKVARKPAKRPARTKVAKRPAKARKPARKPARVKAARKGAARKGRR